ncbi:hypothetical protein PJJ30_24075 [Mycobacterium kansasii]
MTNLTRRLHIGGELRNGDYVVFMDGDFTDDGWWDAPVLETENGPLEFNIRRLT